MLAPGFGAPSISVGLEGRICDYVSRLPRSFFDLWFRLKRLEPSFVPVQSRLHPVSFYRYSPVNSPVVPGRLFLRLLSRCVGRGFGRRVVVRVCRWVWVDGCEVRPCDPCARVRPCVPCVPCVSLCPGSPSVFLPVLL